MKPHTWTPAGPGVHVCTVCGDTRTHPPTVHVNPAHPDLPELKAQAARWGVTLHLDPAVPPGYAEVDP